MKKRLLDLKFPTGGLDRRFAYRGQPPYFTALCDNVRPRDVYDERARGGSRPGLVKVAQEELGSGAPVRMLAEVSVVPNDLLRSWTDEFLGETLGDDWEAASWISSSLPSVIDQWEGSIAFDGSAGAVMKTFSYDTTEDYLLEVYIAPWMGQYWGNTHYLFARMDETTPSNDAGVVAELTITGTSGTVSGYLRDGDGSITSTAFNSVGNLGNKAGWFKMLVSGNNVKCYWQGSLLVDKDVHAADGTRFGFGLQANGDGNAAIADAFRIQYRATSDQGETLYKNYICASAGGSLYRDTYEGQLSAVSTGLTLASDRTLQAADINQKLYIGDNGFRVDSDLAAVATDGVSLTATGITDWSATYGVTAADDVVTITNALGEVQDGVYRIASVSGATITLNESAGGAGACSVRVERGTKVYDPIANTLSLLWASEGNGVVQPGCPLLCHYRDRLVMAAPDGAPQAWFMSRAGDPADWDYFLEDAGAAASSTSSPFGSIGYPITALVPFRDDFLVIASARTLHVLAGDPTYGGTYNQLDATVGIVSKHAWCHGPDGRMIFLSHDGLYSLAASPQARPEQLSREPLPRELLRSDATRFEVCLGYDMRDRGVHIFLTPKNKGSTTHYFFEWSTSGFWPVSIPGDYEPFVSLPYSAHEAGGGLLLGCRDGYLRRFDPLMETDDGTEILSHILYGPIRLSGNDYETGQFLELSSAMAQYSQDVTWELRVADSHEELLRSSAIATGTWSGGELQAKERPRSRGGSCSLRLSGTGAWAIDRITASISASGTHRKG